MSVASSSAFTHKSSMTKRKDTFVASPTDSSSTNHFTQSLAHSTPLSSVPPSPTAHSAESKPHGSLRRSVPLDPIDCIFGVGGWTKELQKQSPTTPSPSRTPDIDDRSRTPTNTRPRQPPTFQKSPNQSQASSLYGISLQSAEKPRPVPPSTIKEAFADVNLALARDSLRREEAIKITKTKTSRSRSSSTTAVSDAGKSAPNSRRASAVDLSKVTGADVQPYRDEVEFAKHLLKQYRRYSAPVTSAANRSRSTGDLTLRPPPPHAPPKERQVTLSGSSSGRLQRSPALSRSLGVPDDRPQSQLPLGTPGNNRLYALQSGSFRSTGSLVSRNTVRAPGTSPIDPVYIPRHLRSSSMYDLSTTQRSSSGALASQPRLAKLDTSSKSLKPSSKPHFYSKDSPASLLSSTPKRVPINLDDPVPEADVRSSRPFSPRRASTGSIPPPQPIDYPAPVDLLKGSSNASDLAVGSSARSSITALSETVYASAPSSAARETQSMTNLPTASRLSNGSSFAAEQVYNEVEVFPDLYSLIPPANTSVAPIIAETKAPRPVSCFKSLKKPLNKLFKRSRSVGDVERRPREVNLSEAEQAETTVWRSAKVAARRAKSLLVNLKTDLSNRISTPISTEAPITPFTESPIRGHSEADEQPAPPDVSRTIVPSNPSNVAPRLRKAPSVSEAWKKSWEKVQSTFNSGEGRRNGRDSLDVPSAHVTNKSVQLSPFSFQSLTLQLDSSGGGAANEALATSSQASHQYVSRADTSLEKWTQELIQMASHDSYAKWWNSTAEINAVTTSTSPPNASQSRSRRPVSPVSMGDEDSDRSTILAVGITTRRVSFGV